MRSDGGAGGQVTAKLISVYNLPKEPKMNTRFLWIVLVLLFVAGLALAQAPKQMSVTVKETQVRATPSYMGRILAVLSYGDRVDVLAEQNGWARVRVPDSQDRTRERRTPTAAASVGDAMPR